MKRIFLLCYFTLFSVQALTARQWSTDTLVVLQIAQEQGLSQLGATSLQFDKQGFLWVGTQNGLNRFNGFQMKVWLADDDTHGFPDDHIRAMHYQNDTLWMTTNTHSLCAYLLAEDRFIHFAEQLDFEHNRFVKYSYSLHPTQDNRLIVGTAGHCLLFDKATATFDILPVSHIMDNDFVTCIREVEGDRYLVGTNSSGAYLLNTKDKSISTVESLQLLSRTQINAIYRRPDGGLLIGSDAGLYKLGADLQNLEKLTDGSIRSIQPWEEGRLLVGAKNGQFFLDEGEQRVDVVFVNHEGREITSDVLAFQQDEQGGRWLGTETRGIFYYHPYQTKFHTSRIQTANSPKADFISIFNFLRDADNLWMATEFGFVKHRLHSDEYKLYRTDLLEYTLTKDHYGTIWVGGFEQGLLRYDRRTDRFVPVSLPFADKDIIQLTPVSTDSIWVHTWSSGIYAMHTRTQALDPVTLFGKDVVRSRTSLVDRLGNIWIGSDEGLYQVRPDRSVVYYDSLSNERVFAIAEDTAGRLWVGTAKGLNELDPQTGQMSHYSSQTGLPNDFIYGVEVDAKGNVWVSTNYGVSVLNHHTRRFKNYTQDDGLQNNEFNGKAAYQDSLGYLYFGGMNGFNIFHPDSIPINRHTGRTHIENVLLFGRPISENVLYSDTLIFSHDQNVITFEFVNLNYLWSKKNRYQFILEGFDKEWRPITQDNSTTYTNLPPGSYRFMVRGSNNELIWGDIEQITVIIQSPWYETTAFRAGMAVLVLLFAGGAFTYKTYEQRKLNKRLQRMVNERTEELSQTNNALHQSLEVSQMQKENITFLMQELNHRVKNNLQLITSLIDIQSFEIEDEDIQDKLRILQSRVFTVSKIHDLLNVRQEGNSESMAVFIGNLTSDLIAFSGQEISFSSDLENVALPSNKLSYLGLVLNELITNSIKHAFTTEQTDKTIRVNLYKKGAILLLEYKDNGVGFDKNKVWGNQHQGMNLIYLLVKELGGAVQVENDDGAKFVIELPHKK